MAIEVVRPYSTHFHRITSGDCPFDVDGYAGAGGRPCREIRATGTGSITVKRASDNGSEQLDVASDGERHPVSCSEITSMTTVTAVTIYW